MDVKFEELYEVVFGKMALSLPTRVPPAHSQNIIHPNHTLIRYHPTQQYQKIANWQSSAGEPSTKRVFDATFMIPSYIQPSSKYARTMQDMKSIP